jgi:hypothetical protein
VAWDMETLELESAGGATPFDRLRVCLGAQVAA